MTGSLTFSKRSAPTAVAWRLRAARRLKSPAPRSFWGRRRVSQGLCLRMLLVPEKLFVGARIDDRRTVADLDDFRGQTLDEVSIVGNEYQRAPVIDECVEQYFLRIQIQVVRRLVQ